MTKNNSLKIITALLITASTTVLSTALQAAPDLDRAMHNPNNWAHPRG